MKFLKGFKLFLLLSIACLDSVGQLRLGQATFAFAAARPLRRTEALATVLSNVSYLRRVGGVAFDKTASPSEGMEVNSLKFRYNSSEPDGERLAVVINGNDVKMKIYDWEFVPIAKYANSDANACFTLFGELADMERADRVRSARGRVLNYHPDLFNTLLGLRLFQLDILIVEPQLSVHLPKDGGVYLLGEGEKAPDIVANKKGAQTFDAALTAMKGNFTSYIICDENQDIRFSVKDNTLSLTGQPFYHFWKFDINDPDVFETRRITQRRQLAVQASAVMGKEIGETAKFNAGERWYLRNLYAAEVDSNNVAFTGNSRYQQMVQAYREQKAFYNLSNAEYLNLLNNELAKWKVERTAKVVYMQTLSKTLSSQPQLFRNINPAIWNAGVKTMRYAAFFRYCKANFPDQWKTFMKQTDHIDAHFVKSPTVMYPEGN